MIAQSYITEWSEKAPWSTNVQVEYDAAVAWKKVHDELVVRLRK